MESGRNPVSKHYYRFSMSVELSSSYPKSWVRESRLRKLLLEFLKYNDAVDVTPTVHARKTWFPQSPGSSFAQAHSQTVYEKEKTPNHG